MLNESSVWSGSRQDADRSDACKVMPEICRLLLEGKIPEVEELDIQWLWLPKRSPHWNPIDHLWGHGKQAVCANVQQGSIEAQVDQFMRYYEMLSPTETLRKAGLLSPNFWLYKV